MSNALFSSPISLLLIIFCCASAWLLAIGLVWSVWLTLRDGVRHLRKLHRIPCDRCQYFTGEYLLKCTVCPCKAFSEDAIGCLDFEARVFDVPTIQHQVCHPLSSLPTSLYGSLQSCYPPTAFFASSQVQTTRVHPIE